MRYEDASGAFQASGPIANDDADTLSAGERGPATGNLITGEGTQYGSAGADSATDGKIVAIAGKGGEDTSFSGGKLSVAGEHGRLSVDAEGNYSYLANANAENVRDRFTYTLADNAGNSDTAALIVEIGKTPAVIKADAQQIVPGPDGVVTLPPGVELSDVRVVGRNLVVDLPDGTQLIIIDGAIFVPQLVLGGVEVPATNVAALLVGQEVQPAAGETTPSSGGNFALPPPPLDPGVPLGDLIPPTEYDYVPPEPEEVFDILDREPEVFVQPDGQPAAISAVDQVEEAGLPGPRLNGANEPPGSGEGSDGNGADNDVTTETTTGNIVYDSPDGVDSITLNGIAITAVGQVINGSFGAVTITSIAPGIIGYSYTLRDNSSGNDTHDDFSVVLTDDDGDTATATLRIDIIDDVPTARPDTDLVPAGQYGPVTGNVITDASAGDAGDGDAGADTVGADNATITAVSSANVPANSDSSAPFSVNGQYGVLTLQSDGSYSYVRNPGTPGGVNDVFNYTLTDGDGDTSTTTLTISIGDATPQTAPNPTAQLDDDALAGGIPGGVGDDPNAVNLSGNLIGSGGDGPLTFDLLLTGAPAGFTYVDGPNGAVHVMQGTTHVLTITINATTGAYTVSQVNPIDHAAGADENNIQFTINYQVRDQDGDTANGTLNIDVDDDTPVMARADVSLPTLTVDETSLAANATGNVSVVFAGAYGADGPGTTVYAVSTVNGTDSGLVDVGTGLPVLLYNIGGQVVGSTSATLAGVTAGNTVFTVGIDANTGVVTLDQLRALDHPANPNPNDPVSPAATSIQATATITDGDGDPASLSVNIGASLVFLDDGPSVDITLGAAAEPVLLTQDTETDGTPTTQDSATANFAANFAVNANGGADGIGSQSVSYTLGVASQGVDSGLEQGGADIYLYLIGGVVVGSTSATEAGVNAGNTVFNVTVDGSGNVTLTQFSQIDHESDPAPTGSPFGDDIDSLADNLVTLTATATVTDGDGDPASDSQTLNIGAQLQFQGDGPDVSAVLTGTLLEVDETDGVGVPGEVDPAGGNLGTITVAAATLFTISQTNVSPDSPTTLGYALSLSADGVASGLLQSATNAPIFLYNIGGVVTGSTSATLAGVNAGNTAFTVSVNSGSGAVTLTQFQAVEHSNPASNDEDSSGLTPGILSVNVTATDFDGDTDGASVDLGSIIRFEDDGPTIDVSVNGQAAEPVLVTQDGETDGVPTAQDSASSAASFGGVFNLAFTTGSDGAATPTLSYALGVASQGMDSGLDSAGASIFLYNIGGVVVGSTSATQAGVTAANTIFNVTVSGTGVVTLTQFAQIDHPIAGDPSATGAPFTDHFATLADTAVTLTASSTITDNDGDTATDSATVNIGANIRFEDDGPDVSAVLAGGQIRIDETDGVTTGAEVDPVGGNLGTVTVNLASLVTVSQPNVSADTPTTLAYSLVLSSDGVASGLQVSSNNAPIFLYNIGGVVTGSTSATLAGVNAGNTAFTVSVNSGSGAVTLTQFLPIEHPTPGASHDEDSLPLTAGVLNLRVTATDFDGDTDFAQVDLGSVIRFEDDGPSAQPDVDVIVGGNGPATGNVLTGVEVAVPEDGNNQDGVADNVGQDAPGRITFIDHSNAAPGAAVPGGGSVAIVGTYGTLTIHSNGDYSYLRTGGPGGVQDVFTYTLTDADGDTTTATLTINIDDNTPTLPDPALVRLDDDALAGGNAGGTDDDVNSAGLPGQLAGTGGDGTLTYNFTGTVSLPPVGGFTYNQVDADTAQVLQGATVVLTIQLNQATGAFTVVQNNPIDHPTAGVSEENLVFGIGVEVEDADGDVEPATITINVDDDTPTINVTQTNETGVVLTTQDAETDGNPTNEDVAVSTANFSGVFALNASPGADGGSATPLSYALAVSNPVSGLASHGVAINLYNVGGVIIGSTALSAPANASDPSVVFTIAVSATGIVTLTQYQQVDHAVEGVTTAPFDDQFAVLGNGLVTLTASSTVTDGDGDTASDQEVIDLGGNIRFADDGPDAVNDVVNQPTENQPVTFGVFGNDAFGADGVDTLNPPPVNVSFTQPAQGGTVTYNANTGQFTFTPAPGQQGVATFTYTITDFDGDTDTATVTINLQPDSTPVAADGVAAVDDDGLAGGNAASVTGDLDANAGEAAPVNPSEAVFHGQLSATSGGDTIASYTFASMHGTNGTVGTETVVYNWNAGTSTLTATTVGGTRPGTVLFDVVINQASGAYDLTLRDNILHAAGSNENDATTNLTFTVTDSDGDPDTGTITVTFDDDAPTLGTIQNQEASNNPAQAPAVGTLHLTIGADSPAVVTTITANNTGITSGGFNLVTNQSGNVLTAYQDVNGNGTYEAGTDTTAVYTLTVNPTAGTSGQYVFDLITALDPTITDTPIGGSSSFGAGPTGFQQLNSATAQPLAIVSGFLEGAGFNEAAWLAGAPATGLTPGGVNGSTSGWGIDNNNFNTNAGDVDEFFNWDFGPQALDDPDGPGGFTPPANPGLPQISTATFEFIGYSSGSGDAISYVVHYVTAAGVPAGHSSGLIPAVNINGALWTHTAPPGLFIADIEMFSGAGGNNLGSGKVDLVSVGIQTSNLVETIGFNVTITDADGDPVSGAFTVEVADGNTPLPPAAMAGYGSTKGSAAVMDSLGSKDASSSLAAPANDTDRLMANTVGNTGITASMVAASGLAAMAMSTVDSSSQPSFDGLVQDSFQSFSAGMAAHDGSGESLTNIAFGQEMGGSAVEAVSLSSSGLSFDDRGFAARELDAVSAENAEPAYAPSYAAGDPAMAGAAVLAANVPAVSMASAEMLQAAGLEGHAQQGAAVEQVLADALGGAPDLDAVLANLPGGGIGELAVLADVTSPDGAAVPAWDMGMHGGFAPEHDMLMKVAAVAIHQDAIQPA